MLEVAKEPTNEEKLEELKKRVANAFFDYGCAQYEIDCAQKKHADIGVRLHNLQEEAKKLQSLIQKSLAKDAMKVNLADLGKGSSE